MEVTPVEFTRIYNQLTLTELCAEVIKCEYISNPNTVFESEFVEMLSPSELAYLKSTPYFMYTVLHTLSMCSPTSGPIFSDVLGK